MAILTVRNVPDEVHRALRMKRIRLGDALAALSREIGLTNEDFAVFDRVRDKTLAEPLRFE
jgi:plasmid stability protein